MSGNSTSPNDSLLSSINSSISFKTQCLLIAPMSLTFTAYTIAILVILLPLCVLVLYHGLQQWRQQRVSSKAAVTHADSFTYHTVTMETIFIFGCIVCCFGIYGNRVEIINVGIHFLTFTWFGERQFHILTSVEHYLAVVHPITYLNLRKQKVIKIRNIAIGFIWLLCFGLTCDLTFGNSSFAVMLCHLISSLIIITFCSFSVLCVLIRPGPGKQGKDRVRVAQSKQKAFYTIVAILGVLLLRCTCNLILSILYALSPETDLCVAVMCEIWFNLPCSLVLPLLFLQRTGILTNYKSKR